MKRKRYTEEQIVSILEQHEAGRTMVDLARECGIAERTLYLWKSNFGGIEVSEAKRLRELEMENAKLKRLLAEVQLDKAADPIGRAAPRKRTLVSRLRFRTSVEWPPVSSVCLG